MDRICNVKGELEIRHKGMDAKRAKHKAVVSALFDLYDEEGEGIIDFRDYKGGLFLLARGSWAEKMGAIYDLYGPEAASIPEELAMLLSSLDPLNRPSVEEALQMASEIIEDHAVEGRLHRAPFVEAMLVPDATARLQRSSEDLRRFLSRIEGPKGGSIGAKGGRSGLEGKRGGVRFQGEVSREKEGARRMDQDTRHRIEVTLRNWRRMGAPNPNSNPNPSS